jgi:branched-chain amino acid transport system ATP-binding protein
MAILEVQDLVVYYGKINALKGVTIAVEEGQIVTLIGSNGAGKSTLLNALTGIVAASDGKVIFKGRDIFNERADRVLKFGLAHVPEGRKIFPNLSVEENLLAGAYLINSKQLVASLLERAYALFPRLAERRKQSGGTLSGGEQQMLAIARGLMSDPDVLLLDEPSLGLAPILVDKIFDFIIEVNRIGKSILLVEQNANIALQVATYGYVLETGKISMKDETKNLIESDLIRKSYLGIS